MTDRMEYDYDYVIVGSGFVALSALRLSKKRL
jgi:thioredoxin reductase